VVLDALDHFDVDGSDNEVDHSDQDRDQVVHYILKSLYAIVVRAQFLFVVGYIKVLSLS